MTASTLRAPRLLVLANGSALPGVIEAEVVNTAHCGADRFSVRAAMGADFVGLANLVDTDAIRVDLRFSLDGGLSFVSFITGAVDQIELDPAGGRLTLSGRDDAAGMIEARTQEIFANTTSSEVATMLAGRHGLLADVQATTTPVGRYWQLEHDSVVLNQFSHSTTEWDLLVRLARFESFDVWVGGGALHFRPAAQALPVATLRPQDAISLRLERNLVLAQDVSVTVKSWNSLKGATVSATVGAPAGGRSYVFVRPNLPADAAAKLAQAQLGEVVAHERVLNADLPGELLMMPRDTVVLSGSNTGFDQPYVIDFVSRHMSMAHGFTERLRARAASPAGAD